MPLGAHLHLSSHTVPWNSASRNTALSSPCNDTSLKLHMFPTSSSCKCWKLCAATESPARSRCAMNVIPFHWKMSLQSPSSTATQCDAARAGVQQEDSTVRTNKLTKDSTVLQLTFWSSQPSMGQKRQPQTRCKSPLPIQGCSVPILWTPREGAVTVAARTAQPRAARISTKCVSNSSSSTTPGVREFLMITARQDIQGDSEECLTSTF